MGPQQRAILRSSDQGNSWQATTLPFKLGGNMPGRGMGERLSVDPNNDSVLYLAAPSGNGLWRSTDSGVTWAKVSSFPNVGNYAPDPTDQSGYQSQLVGVTWVSFDKSTGSSGSTTQGIYVGVADKQNTVYRSTDGGATWSAILGAPTGYLAHKGVVDPVNHLLYIATSDTSGPGDGAKGDVWKYDIGTGAWTQISPILSSSSDDYFGYSGLTIDRQHPGTIMVATQVSWYPDVIFFRSTDSGATWTRIWDFSSYPERSLRYTQDISSVPWLSMGVQASPPAPSPRLGWMTESMEIDPFNSDRMMYGTGATLYGTTNLTNWDTGSKITITPMVKGLEETAVIDLISPPSGPPLISALGDVGGFRHDDLTKVPSTIFTQPIFSSTRSIDYAETNPNVIVRAGDFTDSDRPSDSHVAFSTDSGANWFQGTEPGGVNQGGSVAAAADGSRFVWAPGDSGLQVVYSVGFGNTWNQSSGVPANATIKSDRVNPNTFYAFKNGTFYRSTNGGASFASTAAGGLPTSNVYLKAVPGHEGDLWLSGGSTSGAYGLWHSTDSGTTFTKVSTVQESDGVGFGKAAPGQSYPAVYTYAKIDGVRGIYRSDDGAASWVRINDDQHQYGNAQGAITGDPRIYGRVYVSGNGRGIIYGDRTGTTTTTTTTRATTTTMTTATTRPTTTTTTPTTSTTSTTRPTITTTTTTRPTTTTSTTTGTQNGSTCSVAYTIASQWQGAFQGSVKITNTGTSPINGWTAKWTFPNGQVISQLWNGDATQSGADVTVVNSSYNGTISAGGSVDLGFLASWNNTSNAKPTGVTLNNAPCTLT